MPAGPVHFIWLGGRFVWQHLRAIYTARVHGAPLWLWSPTGAEIPWPDAPVVMTLGKLGVELHKFDLPDEHRDHPIQLANVKDFYAWKILHEHGGLYLDLDTISLQPIWDLLTRDVLVSQEWPDLSDPVARHPYNSAVVAGREGADVLAHLRDAAGRVLDSGESGWGETGPHLLTDVVASFPDEFDVAPFGVLNGWRDDTIDEYYDGARPGPDVRVVHLYSSSRPDRFLADRWTP
jgi:hypothetical protein